MEAVGGFSGTLTHRAAVPPPYGGGGEHAVGSEDGGGVGQRREGGGGCGGALREAHRWGAFGHRRLGETHVRPQIYLNK